MLGPSSGPHLSDMLTVDSHVRVSGGKYKGHAGTVLRLTPQMVYLHISGVGEVRIMKTSCSATPTPSTPSVTERVVGNHGPLLPLRDCNVAELRAVIDAERLGVKKNTGGVQRRTKLDIVADIEIARRQRPDHSGPASSAQHAAPAPAPRVQPIPPKTTPPPRTASPRPNPRAAVLGSPPRSFLCPISADLFADPVVTADGQTYDRASIERHFAGGRITSPLTNLPLPSRVLVPNIVLRGAISEWREQHEKHTQDQEWVEVEVA